MNKSLIYDLGLHKGGDAKFYLEKGFRVVGVEANYALAKATGEALAPYVLSGSLAIINKAIYDRSDAEVPFFVNDVKDDWSSLYKGAAEKGVSTSREVKVITITLDDLYREYGVPYFLKCDLEGGDLSVAWQLAKSSVKPKFASFEVTDVDLICALRSAGYAKFQLVNQAFNHLSIAPNPAREGTYVAAQFNGYTSGLFGRELQEDRWVNVEAIFRQYLDFTALRARHDRLALGWIDIHATT